ncbi:MAG: hypothetical protein QXJ75_05045 [Candidatus Bathyarchaeia archaeon]
MEKVGVLIVSYGSREAAMVDSFCRSRKYNVELYIADRQRNPFNAERAKEHAVIPDLRVEKICEFAEKHKDKIDFGIVGPEGPIIDGVREMVEEKTGIPMICPNRRYALEASKVEQRLLIRDVIPEANPSFKVFTPGDYADRGRGELVSDVKEWIAELGGVNSVVIKPDKPGFGKGVGVGGEHFTTMEEALQHFFSICSGDSNERVIVEERVEGEESSFQAWCDGKSLVALPDTRDYKRAFDGDWGPNTGGTGSYKARSEHLPFMTQADREEEVKISQRIFERLRKGIEGSELRGMPFYIAFIHTGKGLKILEINSRPGDPEIINLLPLFKEDFIDLCYEMIHGTLKSVDVEPEASVVTYAMPLTYGGYRRRFSGEVPVDLTEVYKLSAKYGDRIRIYPGSMEMRDDGKSYALRSRAVCVVGLGEDIQSARAISLEGVTNIDGALWNRWDIGSAKHIAMSINHMERLRR